MLVTERKNSRGKIEILADILSNCQEGLKKTHIMLRANLGYEQICYYLPGLIRTHLINQEIEAGSVIYRTTETGREFLLNYSNIIRLIHHENVNSAHTQFTIGNDLCPEKFPVTKSS